MIYEDPLITIAYPARGAVQGHLVVAPQEEAATVDQLSDEVITQLSFAASYAATVLFETLGAQGTNLILNENPVRFDVIARTQEDGWEHQWTPQALDQGVMDDVQEKIRFNTPIDSPEESVQPQLSDPSPEVTPHDESIEALEEKENQLIRQLTRRP